MATPIPNDFTQFLLNDEELKAGHTFSQTQLMVLQNIRAEYAQKKVRLKFDPANQQQYLQEEAETHGWINCITFLLTTHDDNNQPEIVETTDDPAQSGSDYLQFGS